MSRKLTAVLLAIITLPTLFLYGCKDKNKKVNNESKPVITQEQTEEKKSISVSSGYFVDYTDSMLNNLAMQKIEEILMVIQPIITGNLPVTTSDIYNYEDKTYYLVRSEFARDKNDIYNYLVNYMTDEMANKFFSRLDSSVLIQKPKGLYTCNISEQNQIKVQNININSIVNVNDYSVTYSVSYEYIYTSKPEEINTMNCSFELVVTSDGTKVAQFTYPELQ